MISIANPIWLFLLPVLIGLSLYIGRKELKFFKGKLVTSLRVSIIILLVLSMCEIGFKVYSNITTTIFVSDLSGSLKNSQNEIQNFISQSLENKENSDLVGVVAFGENAVVEIAPSDEVYISGFDSYVTKNETNIESALKIGETIIDPESEKRLVLISDGIETKGNASQYANVLNGKGISVDTYYINSEIEKEVEISEIITPNVMDKNTTFQVEVVTHSLSDTNAQVKIYKGSTLVINEELNLIRGENRFVFNDISDVGGGIIYRGEITASEDNYTENNTSYAYTYIEDVASVLIIENSNNSGEEYRKILKESNVKVEVISAQEAPLTFEQLNLWDGIILCDISLNTLPTEFITALEVFVRTTGGGLVVTGGENSYALGDYNGSVLADILPVSMEIETEGEKPDLGMIMVIDHSGSMSSGDYGISRMDMAKEAAIRGVEVMDPSDSIGVIAFDSEPTVVVPFVEIGSDGGKQAVINSIAGIQPAGGTSILPALSQAYETLKNANTKTKHIILLTDGQAETSGYDTIINDMNAQGITLSTIAVGDGADTSLLSQLAQSGGGRYYFTSVFTDLPQIFAKETILAGKEYINNRQFYPTNVDGSSILTGIEALPPLDGYISATAKPRGDVVLQSDTEEPILSTWQYGLGRVAAWTSDVSGNWTSNYLTSNEGVHLLRNIASWTLRGGVSSHISIESEKNEDFAKITATMPYDENITGIFATIINENSEEVSFEMESESPGVYVANAYGLNEGGYVTTLELSKKDGTTEIVRSGLVVGYGDEYKIKNISQGKENLEKISLLSEGQVLNSPLEVFREVEKTALKTNDLSSILLIIAIILFLLEIAVRRISLISNYLEGLFFKNKNLATSLSKEEEKIIKEKPLNTKKVSKNEVKNIPNENATTAKTLADNLKKRR